ncbi:MAG: PIN domain-containing protein [Magnetococcales bacterium]|nr:PIN domain-containing protein [Magnetococcales bacterium]
MSVEFFLDSNVVIYAFSSTETDKRCRSRALLETSGAWVSIQVLNELANVMMRKFNQTSSAIRKVVNQISSISKTYHINSNSIGHALNIVECYHYAYYDSLIIAAALESGCTMLYTEDMQHGQVIDSQLTIINPFRDVHHEHPAHLQ